MADLDEIDLKLLRHLQHNSDRSTRELAELIDLSVTATYERIKRLEKVGFIKRYAAQLDSNKLGFELLIFMTIALKSHNKKDLKRFESRMNDLREVLECNHVTGEFDYLLKTAFRSMDEYRHFVVDRLTGIESIGQLNSHIVLQSVKQTTVLPI